MVKIKYTGECLPFKYKFNGTVLKFPKNKEISTDEELSKILLKRKDFEKCLPKQDKKKG